MRFLTSLSRRQRVQIAIAASLIIHVLAISVYQHWATDGVTQLLRPVRMQPAPTTEPDRFRPPVPGRLPQAVMERLRSETELPPIPTPLPSGDESPLPDLPHLPELSTRVDDAPTERGKESLPREQISHS